MRLFAVPRAHVPILWSRAEPWLRSVAVRSGGDWTVDDYRDAIDDRTAQLWLIYDCHGCTGVLVTQIVEAPSQTHCELLACGGVGADQWVHLLDWIRPWAREEGASVFRIVGRRGWLKMLRGFGFREIGTVMDAAI